MSTCTRRTFVAGTGAAAAVAAAGNVALALAEPADGTYTESAEGRNGLVTVDVTFKDGAIASVQVTDHQETEVYTADAIPQLCDNIVEAQSFGIDGISGATWTSAAILTCVRAAVEEAGGDVEAFNKPSAYEQGPDEEVDADVLVIGGGMSGIFCATRAAQAGAKVVLVEKVRLVGGCSDMSFSDALYEPEQVNEKMVSWISEQMYAVDPALIHKYLENSRPAFDYALEVTDNALFPYYGDPNAWLPTMLAPYTDRPGIYNSMLAGAGVDVRIETTAEMLLFENSTGTVIGAVCGRRDGSKFTVNAKATVIATGGLGGDTAWLKELSGYDVVCGCLTQDVGEGMKMAWDVGAAKPKNLGGMMLHQTLACAKLRGYEFFQQQMPMILGYVPSVLDVTTAGVRLRNEDWVNTAVATASGGAFAGGTTYAMLDQAMVDALMTGGTAAIGFTESPGMPPEYKPQFDIDTPWEGFQQVLDDCVANGWAFTGGTVEELAEAAGMTPEVLAATVETYNGYCDAGQDTFFGKTPEHLVALKTAPFYLVAITYNQLGTVGGINVNDQFQALTEDRKAIPGLYSVGSDAYGTCWNRNYYGTGDGIGFAMVSGYAAGPIVAEYALA